MFSPLKGLINLHPGETRELVPLTTPFECDVKPLQPRSLGSALNDSISPPPNFIELITGESPVDSIVILNLKLG